MTRRQALEELKSLFKRFEDAIQGDHSDRESQIMQLVDPYAENLHVNECVEAAQHSQAWINQEIEKELEFENALLPEEGNPGYLVDQ